MMGNLDKWMVAGAVLAGCVACDPDPCDGLASGHACTWLGIPGEGGYNGDLDRRQTEIYQVQDLMFHSDGTAWFSDFNNFLLRRVNADGSVQTMVGWTDPIFPGDGPLGGIPGDGGDGAEWQLNHPTALLEHPTDQSVVLIAWHNHKILHIDPDDGHVRVRCGGGAGFAGDGGPVSGALFRQLVDASYDADGNLYIVDQANLRIRRIGSDDMLSTIAGTGVAGFSGDGGPAAEAQFAWATGSNPNPSGGIVAHEGRLFISDTENHRVRVIDLATMTIDTLAGDGEPAFGGDGGPARDASLYGPRDLEIGPDGDLYIADTNNARIRAVDLETLEIRTVIGTGELGVSEEGLVATDTMLRRPFGIAFDPAGDLYVMDSLNSRVVRVAR